MSQIPDYPAVTDITSTGYVLGVEDGKVVRFPASTFKGVQGSPGNNGADGTSCIVKRAYTSTGSLITGSTILPYDNTIPQNTEGFEVITLAFTPTNAANTLIIEAIINVSPSVGAYVACALFRDSGADALAVSTTYMATATGGAQISLRHETSAGSTSATTFKVRCGMHTAGTLSVNGDSGAAKFGGTYSSNLALTEYTP